MITSGQKIGNYQIIGKIGYGGMGEVFKAFDERLKREVAIKILRSELSDKEDLLERFRQEAVILAKLNHQNIAILYGFLGNYSPYCMIMEFAYGITLLEYIKRHPAGIPLRQAMNLFNQILAGLEHAHNRGVIHRDIKPANIMVNNDSEIKVMDFGIGRILEDQHLTQSGTLMGTVKYMSPEQILGQEADARSDVYSLAILIYEMLTGKIPFNVKSEYEITKAHVEYPPRPISQILQSIPKEIEDVLMLALSKKPDGRYNNAGDFRRHLNSVLARIPIVDDDTRVQVPVVNNSKKSLTRSNLIVGPILVIALIIEVKFSLLNNVFEQFSELAIVNNADNKNDIQLQVEAEAKRKAELEAKKQAELEAKRKAEADVKRQLELEAQRKAELEAKKQAELEAKRKAEADVKRQLELEAQHKTELEARQKAEMETKMKNQSENIRKKNEDRNIFIAPSF